MNKQTRQDLKNIGLTPVVINGQKRKDMNNKTVVGLRGGEYGPFTATGAWQERNREVRGYIEDVMVRNGYAELINEMLDQIDPSLFRPGKTFLEPAAGDGNMVIEYLKRKLAHGCTPTEALKDTFAVEYMKDNLESMRNRVLDLCGRTPEHESIVNEQIVHANFLNEFDTEDGRCYPRWLRETGCVEDFYE